MLDKDTGINSHIIIHLLLFLQWIRMKNMLWN